MALTVLLGGARSGKSSLAVRLGRRQDAPVIFVATGQPSDADMLARIDRHRRERPATWETVEEPVDLCRVLTETEPGVCLIIDCLSLWTANMMRARDSEAVQAEAAMAAAGAARRPGATIVVSNEVGMGVHPSTALGRDYRDLLGRVNAIWAAAAQQSFLIVAGRALRLSDTAELLEAGHE